MKKLLTFGCLFFVLVSFSQEFQGKAIYKTHRKMSFSLDSTSVNQNPDMEKQISAMLKKQFQKTFTLNFTKSESVYKEDEKLSAPAPQGGLGVSIVVVGNGGGSDVYYKNTKENRYVNKTEIMGKRFLIKDEISKIDWELTGETKSIGMYTCYKATSSREEERINMSMVNGESKETKKKETIVTTAWYTPQIPVSNGPLNFGGLPGLILEINEGDLTIVCSEIVLNPSDKVSIKEPTKGKVISQEKFNKLSREKSKEMMERFRSRRGDGNSFEISIGG